MAAAAPLGTRRPVSSGLPKCDETATCVRGPVRCEPPAGRCSYSSAPDCGSNSRAGHGSPADRTAVRKKTFCCVTTHRRNIRVRSSLRRTLGSLAARALRLGMLSFHRGILATLSLPPRRLPTANLLPALWLLAVTLIPAPRPILTPAPLAQADPRPSASRSGMTAAISLNLVDAHGSGFSLAKPGENASTFSSGASQDGPRQHFASLNRRQATKQRIRRLQKCASERNKTTPRRLSSNACNWLRFPARSQFAPAVN